MICFFAMVLLHLLYDFHWQGDFVAKVKASNNLILGVHALTWAMLLCVPLYLLNYSVLEPLVFLAITHAAVDYWKARLCKADPLGWPLYVDQAAHIATVAVAIML